jgi:two-component system, NarL family, sensor kinase
MDAQEASLYNILILAATSIFGILAFSAFIAVRRHAIYHRVYKMEIDKALNKLESERTRIAADIHDDLGPQLSAIKVTLMSIEPADKDDEAQLEKCNNYLAATSEKLRIIAKGLMPSVLIKKGLEQAISQFIEDFNLKEGLVIELEAEELPALKQQASIHIFRLVQEIVHNTIKHSEASRLYITLEISGQYLSLRTADNGIGFNEKEVRQQHTGYGLTNLQSRVKLLNGRCSLSTATGKGTRYAIDLPLKHVAKQQFKPTH